MIMIILCLRRVDTYILYCFYTLKLLYFILVDKTIIKMVKNGGLTDDSANHGRFLREQPVYLI